MVRRAGFTVVELVLALVLLGIGLVGSAGLMVHSQTLMRRAETREWAARVARSLADSLGSAWTESEGERTEPHGRVAWASWNDGGVLRIRIEVVPVGRAETLVFETARGPVPMEGAR